MTRAARIAGSSPASNDTLVHVAVTVAVTIAVTIATAIAIDPQPGPPVGSIGHVAATRSRVGSP